MDTAGAPLDSPMTGELGFWLVAALLVMAALIYLAAHVVAWVIRRTERRSRSRRRLL